MQQQNRTRTGAGAAVNQLVAEGVPIVLGIPGEHSIHLCDAVLDYPELRFIGGRHEQSLAFMANGYARASGRIIVPVVIGGPGVTNSLTALADAYCDSVPMVLIASCPDPRLRGRGAFHEVKDQTGVLASVTKWNVRVERPEAIPETIRHAFHQAYAGRPGPTAVEIPVPVQAQAARCEAVAPVPPPRVTAEPEAVREAARRLNEAHLPVVLVGGGGARADCARELVWLIERLEAPCFATALGKGVVPEDHRLSLGYGLVDGPAGRALLEEATLVLVIGSSLDEVETGRGSQPLPENLIQIDTCAEVIGRNYPAAVGLVGDATAVLEQLREALTQLDPIERGSPAARIACIKAQTLEKVRDRPSWQFINAAQQALPADAIVTNDASLMNAWVLTHLQRSTGRTMFITRSLAALGSALPTAMGAKTAYPDRQVVAIVGDGGFLFTSESLATAVHHALNVVVVVFNDNCYGSIKRAQVRQFGRTVGVDLVNPDFVALAEAYGAAGLRAQAPDELRRGLLEAFDRHVPTVIEIPWETDLGSL